MSDENYHKCKTCRYCSHKGDSWYCVIGSHDSSPESSCDRYRPGCCENCSMFYDEICSRDGSERYPLDVCTFYDPSGHL